jgi:hypothetical protein
MAFQEDRSLDNSVKTFRRIFNANTLEIARLAEAEALAEKAAEESAGKPRGRGRPKLYKPQIPKSKTLPISSNTASFSNARKRLNLDLVESVFKETAGIKNSQKSLQWHGREVFLTDGSYIQLQDTPELRQKYGVRKTKQEGVTGYPSGLLQGLVHQGTGKLSNFTLGPRSKSELELFAPMIERIPKGSLVLADDLYNTYAMFCLFKHNQIDFIVPAKRTRNYTVVKELGKGDEIIELTRTERPKWLQGDFIMPPKILVRRISYPNPNSPGEEYVLMTSILDPKITAVEIILKYTTRWDIEITIREIKTIMGVNIIRGTSENMALKELNAAFIAYNMAREIIAESAQEADFSPQEDFLQAFFENNKSLLVDKRGRMYSRWSPGRYPNNQGRIEKGEDS